MKGSGTVTGPSSNQCEKLMESTTDDLKLASVVLDNALVNFNIGYKQVNKDEIIYLTKRSLFALVLFLFLFCVVV